MVDPPPPAGPGPVERRLLTEEAFRAATGRPASTVWRMRRDGLFPQPVRISRGRVGWPEGVVLAWMTARACEELLLAPHGPHTPGKPARGRPRARPRKKSNLSKATSKAETSPVKVLRKSVVSETSEGHWSAPAAAEARRLV
ncbi:helix-turn-helix transcriptional regulator [Brevundimonas sp. CEF1]|uniref:helix-turn-helix transcriptional regulator n=1 Tax=Brevundimonas sp. CEF1 TaxID=3442642 RepID=UPI003F517B6D